MTRPSFDELYLELAINLARRSECGRLKVGCVIASADGRYIFGQGYNGGPAGLEHHCTGEVGACFPGSTTVSARSVLAAYRRRYSGVVARIVTREGEFTATANHPVLALGRGWVRADALAKGDKIAHRRGRHDVPAVAPYDYDSAPLEQIFDSLALAFGSVRERAVRHQLDGDAAFGEYVDVVSADGSLRHDVEPSARKFAGEPRFASSDSAERCLPSFRARFQSGRRGDEHASLFCGHSTVVEPHRVADLAANEAQLIEALVDNDARDAERFRERLHTFAFRVPPRDLVEWERMGSPFLVGDKVLGRAAKNTGIAQSLLDRGVRNTKGGRDRDDGLASVVPADDVLRVELHRWSGHVFNLATTASWYCVGASATVVHNCGCLHAEDNAVTNCTAPRSEAKIVLLTNAPCVACATRLINLGGVRRVVWLSDYRVMTGAELLARAGIEARRWEP